MQEQMRYIEKNNLWNQEAKMNNI